VWGKIVLKCLEVGESGEFKSEESMFIGEYQHSIDPKKRMAIPSRFRGDLGNKVVITRGLDKCLFVYPMKVWEELAEKLGSLPMGEAGTRSFVRMILAGACDVEIDKQGRVLIPDYLKEYGELGKNVVIVGLFNRIEVWSEEKWNKYKDEAEGNSDQIAEQLGKLGIY
jgi:MraZ protein